MKKLLYVLTAALLVVSCSVDNDENASNSENLTYQTSDENSNVGTYKGVFTTNNSEYRATVQLNIPFSKSSQESVNQFPNAVITLQNGEVIFASANEIVQKGTDITNLSFTSQDLTFVFSVNADGTNPQVNNVVYRNIDGDVLIAKHTLRAPVVPITGTFNCTTCGTHPTMNTGVTQTFNVLSITDIGGGTSTIDTQLNLNGTTFTGTGTQDSCTVDGNYTTCDASGSFTVTSNPDVIWSGQHLFNNEAAGPNDCSGLSGTWSWASANYGAMSGNFVSDNDCRVPVELYNNDFDLFTGTGFSPTPTAGQLDSNIVIPDNNSTTTPPIYGDTFTTATFARGTSTGGVITSGVYAFEVETGNFTVGIQPSEANFSPGTLEWRIQNTNTETYTEIDINADLWVNNDEERSSILTLEYSTNGTTFIVVPGDPNEVTQEASDANGFEMDALIDKTITGLSLATNDYIYFRVTIDDSTGSGSRDEIAIDNLVISGIE